MGAETSIASVALVVSLVALFVTLAQLLQQIFGTAEGYRRCQESIIGPWARLRRRRIRVAELRMETQFETPDFSFITLEVKNFIRSDNIYHFNGNQNKGLVPKRGGYRKGQVGWLPLMSAVHDLEQNYDSYGGRPPGFQEKSVHTRRVLPVFQPVLQSWDLMPPDVVRPLATATLGSILVLAHRLGMSWTAVNPSEGALNAEGNGQSLIALDIRSFGLALQYTDKNPQYEKTEDYFRAPKDHVEGSRSLSRLFIPTREADKMAFGFIPADSLLDTAEYCISEGLGNNRRFQGVQETLLALNVEWKAVAYCTRGVAAKNFFSEEWTTSMWNGISDAVYLLTPWLPLPNTGAVAVRLPHRFDFQTPLNWREGRVVLLARLKRVLDPTSPSTSVQLQRVYSHLNKLATEHPHNFTHITKLPYRWKSHYGSSLTTEKGLLTLKEIYDEAVAYLRSRPYPYTDLVASHIEVAVEAHKKTLAMPEKDHRKCDEISDFYYSWLVEQTHQYVDNLVLVQKAMERRHSGVDLDGVRDAWWTMMLKGIVWGFSIQAYGGHSWQSYSPIPSQFWGSDLPIYIT